MLAVFVAVSHYARASAHFFFSKLITALLVLAKADIRNLEAADSAPGENGAIEDEDEGEAAVFFIASRPSRQ